MFRRKPAEGESVFRLNRKLLYPLAILLAMPLVTVARSILVHGFTRNSLVSLGLLALIILLFLPWLTRKVVVSAGGIFSGTLFSHSYIGWKEVQKVSGYEFRGRALIMLNGGGRRILITDIIGNFKHLVGYIIEHASKAVIEKDVGPLVLMEGRASRDAALLWIATAAMALLVVLKLWLKF